MHVFTSITANYLPKAAVLAHSVKRHHPEATFHLVLSDELPVVPDATLAAFDTIITPDELPIPDRASWIFKHRLVELCTAVKGPAMQLIADRYGAERVYYLDPDIVVFSRLDGLERALDNHSVLLTPHQTHPESDPRAIADNEICALKHGVFNLGFLAVRMTPEGRRFRDWWAERLLHHCYDDIPGGLFTDQRWVDLAPAFFDDIAIIREPQYNVATWNLTHRKATGTAPDGVLINGRPLAFYHFSGFDSGAQLAMLERYGAESPVLFDLRDWYLARCDEFGQSSLGRRPSIYARFDNGEPITDAHRLLYRRRADLIKAFPNPFQTSPKGKSYYHWFQAQAAKSGGPEPTAASRPILHRIRDHAPPPALRLARTARTALRRLVRSA